MENMFIGKPSIASWYSIHGQAIMSTSPASLCPVTPGYQGLRSWSMNSHEATSMTARFLICWCFIKCRTTHQNWLTLKTHLFPLVASHHLFMLLSFRDGNFGTTKVLYSLGMVAGECTRRMDPHGTYQRWSWDIRRQLKTQVRHAAGSFLSWSFGERTETAAGGFRFFAFQLRT